MKENKITVGFDVSDEQWRSYFFIMAYDKHSLLCLKFQKPSNNQTWQDDR